MADQTRDLVIVGGGIVGTALFFAASRYSNLERILLLEKHDSLGRVNSASDNNSQTLHFGDIETNYSLEKARGVRAASELTAAYLERYAPEAYRPMRKMVLGVGPGEVAELEARFEEFRRLFPGLRKAGREELAQLEPKVVEGRDPATPLLALVSEEGHAVDFGRLADSFAARAQRPGGEVRLGAAVRRIIRSPEGYRLELEDGTEVRARTVVVAAGPHSLVFAKTLGYGKDFGILPVAGNFYCARNVLRGKVYMVQIKGMPFAALHGDPDVSDPTDTRFGPTIRVLPVLERHNYRTIRDFLTTSVWSPAGVWSLVKITLDPSVLRFVIKNILYDLPLIGKRIFLRWEVRKIVPSLRARDIRLNPGVGGIRPQVVNVPERRMEMGAAEIAGDGIVFNITPSPGASVCLNTAADTLRRVVGFLGEPYRFEEEAFRRDLTRLKPGADKAYI